MLDLIKQYLKSNHSAFSEKSSWRELLKLRAINRRWKRELESLCEDYFFEGEFPILGSRAGLTSIINTRNCEHCGRISDLCQISASHEGDMGATTFLQDQIPRKLIIRCNNDWRCRYAALVCRARVSAKQKIFYCYEPLLNFGECVLIPRSDGSQSVAYMGSPFLIRWSAYGSQFCGILQWSRNREEYIKHVPLNRIFRFRKKLSESEMEILEYLKDVLNSNVVSIIEEFLTLQPRIKPHFWSWGEDKWKTSNSPRLCNI